MTCEWCGETAAVLYEAQFLCGRCFAEESTRETKAEGGRAHPPRANSIDDALGEVKALLPALAHWLRRLDEMWTR